jgi:hypothetical protein
MVGQTPGSGENSPDRMAAKVKHRSSRRLQRRAMPETTTHKECIMERVQEIREPQPTSTVVKRLNPRAFQKGRLQFLLPLDELTRGADDAMLCFNFNCTATKVA